MTNHHKIGRAQAAGLNLVVAHDQKRSMKANGEWYGSSVLRQSKKLLTSANRKTILTVKAKQ